MFSTWYGKSRNLEKRIQSDKFLRDNVFKIASDSKYDGYQRGLASTVYKLFDKKASRSGVAASLANKSAIELQMNFINLQMNFTNRSLENSRKWKFIHLYRDNIWAAELTDMQSLS